ncbi:MAG: 2'-5' RNA ligase family protein [Acidimicrobiales bacterium]
MARYEVAVVVLLEGPEAIEVQALRRALGDPDLDHVAPHLTVVPPLRLRGAELEPALALLRAAARRHPPFEVLLGPPATFAPVTATLHLPVLEGGERLAGLRTAVFRPPLVRETHPYVPHVTLLASAGAGRIAAACELLAGFRTAASVHRLTMVARRRTDDGASRWAPLADVDLDGVRAVGAGPLAVELAAGTVADPPSLALLAPPAGTVPAGLVVLARRGAPVGLAWRPAEPDGPGGPVPAVFVDTAVRGQGIGTLLRREWLFRDARRRAAETVSR